MIARRTTTAGWRMQLKVEDTGHLVPESAIGACAQPSPFREMHRPFRGGSPGLTRTITVHQYIKRQEVNSEQVSIIRLTIYGTDPEYVVLLQRGTAYLLQGCILK